MMTNKINLYVIFSAILFICCIIIWSYINKKSMSKPQVIKINDVALQRTRSNGDLIFEKIHSLIKKISTGESFAQEEEIFYFGEEGINNLGRSLSKYEKNYGQDKRHMLGQIVIDKFYPLLSGYDVYVYSLGNTKAVGCLDGTLRGGSEHVFLTVIFRDTNYKKEDLCLILDLYIPQDKPDNFYIRLHLSYLNGVPLWKVLGFSRHERIWGEFYPPQHSEK